MAVTAVTVRRGGRLRMIKGSLADDARHASGLWPLGTGDHQHCGLCDFCLQFHKAEDEPRLAFLWRLLGLYRRAVHRDVRLSADDLPAFGLADAHLSGYRSLLARCGTFVVDIVWAARRPALEHPPSAEHCGDLWRLHSAISRVEGAL